MWAILGACPLPLGRTERLLSEDLMFHKPKQNLQKGRTKNNKKILKSDANG